MIPVLRLRRNVTYTFIVEAGDNPDLGPNYHPFYITDSEDGGILLDTPEERLVSKSNITSLDIPTNILQRKNERVFAGYDLATNQPTAGTYVPHIGNLWSRNFRKEQ